MATRRFCKALTFSASDLKKENPQKQNKRLLGDTTACKMFLWVFFVRCQLDKISIRTCGPSVFLLRPCSCTFNGTLRAGFALCNYTVNDASRFVLKSAQI